MILRNIDHFEFKLRNKNLLHLLLPWLKFNPQKHSIELIEVVKDSAVTLCTQNQREALIIIAGEGGVTIGAKGSLIKSGDLISVPANSVRSIANISDEPLYAVSIKYILETDI